jgi:hypothetical protein
MNAALRICIAVLTYLVLEHKYLLATFPMLTLTDIATRHTHMQGKVYDPTDADFECQYTFPRMCV